MKKLLIYIMGLSIILLLFSCKQNACEEHFIKITNIQSNNTYALDYNAISIFDDGPNRFVQIKYIKTEKLDPISTFMKYDTFHVLIETEFIVEGEDEDCKSTYLNNIELDSVKLICNKQFMFRTDTIFPGDDLFSIGWFYDIGPVLRPLFYASNNTLRIIIMNIFFTDSKFTPGEHIFKIEYQTNDGIFLWDEISLIIQ